MAGNGSDPRLLQILSRMFDGAKNALRVFLYTDGGEVTIQNPLPTDGDSVYSKGIWVDESIVTDWTDLDSTGLDVACIPFTNLHTRIENATSDNPKTLLIHFNRTVSSNQVGLGSYGGGNFSNVTVTLLGSGGVEREVLDDSANDTKYTSKNYQFDPSLFNAIRLDFATIDTVTISNITIQKSILTEAHIKAQKTDRTMVNIGASDSGNLKITDAENGLAIAKGEVEGSSFIHKFGAAPDFDNTDGFVTIWDGADDGNLDAMVYTYSTTADIDSISSSDNTDDQTIQVQGLDSNWALHIQEVTLQGQTRVALTTPLIRVFRQKNVGSTDNAGQIYVYVNGTISGGIPTDKTLARSVMRVGMNQTLMAVFTIPAGVTGYMRDWYASTAGASKDSNYAITLRARSQGGVFQLKHVTALEDGGTSYVKHDYTEPEVFGEMTDLEMRAWALAGGVSGAAVAAGFDIVLVDN